MSAEAMPRKVDACLRVDARGSHIRVEGEAETARIFLHPFRLGFGDAGCIIFL